MIMLVGPSYINRHILPQSAVSYFPAALWFNCGLNIYLAEKVIEEFTLFIHFKIKSTLNYITLPAPALGNGSEY